MQQAILITFLIYGTSLALPPSISKQYRDYEYNRETDAFYKLHIENKIGRFAKEACKNEAAQLMVPSNKEDIAQLRGMLKQFPDIDLVFVGNDGQNHESAEEAPIIDLTPSSSENNPDDSWVCEVINRFGELKTTFCQNHESAEEAPIIDLTPSSSENNPDDSWVCEVINRFGELETTFCHYHHPFICKVDAKDAPYDEQCDVYGKDYKYYDNVKSCYKVPQITATWEEAFSECRAEKAHLVVLNSEAESQTVKEFLKTAPRHSSAQTFYLFFAGIRANRPTDGTTRVFRTIFNETLEEAGFSEWSDGEPNNYQDSEYCGTIFDNNGKYNDVVCSHYYGFICEKEVAPK